MGKVVVGLSMSLDGYIAGPDDGPEHPLGRGGERLFAWMSAGPEANRIDQWMAPPDASVPVVEAWSAECGAIVSGRRTFDIANGWKDGHPVDVPIFVVTHEAPTDAIVLEQIGVIGSDGVTHLRYRVVRP
jgi:dihydrofolate reductase